MDIDLLNEISPLVRFVNSLKNCNNQNHKIPWRKLLDYEIIFVTEGEMIVKTKTSEYVASKNQVHIMQPNVYHTRFFKENTHCNYYNIHLDFFHTPYDENFNVFDTYISEIMGKQYVKSAKLKRRATFENIKVANLFNVFEPDVLSSIFEEFLAAYRDSSCPYNFLNLKQICYKLILHLLKECEKNELQLFEYEKNLHIDFVDHFVEHVHKNFDKKIDLNEIVINYGLSKNHFSKIFKKQYNVSPHTFLISVRIDEAKKLLKSGKYMINEIAEKVGYDDVAYFSRIFKLKEGVSPLKYLKRK